MIDAIYTFHMPLFFVLSGLFFSPTTRFIELVRKRAKTLLIPYYVFSVFALAGPVVKLLRPQLYAAEGKSTEVNPIQTIVGIVLAQGNSGLWFLWSLFTALMALWGLVRITKSNRVVLLIIFLTFIVIDYAINTTAVVENQPFQLGKIFEATAFVGMGYLLAQVVDLKQFESQSTPQRIAGSVALLVLFLLFEHFSIFEPTLTSFPLYVLKFLTTISGIAAALALSLIIRPMPWLTAIGQYSLVFYSLNDITLKLTKFMLFSVGHIPITLLAFVWQLLIGLGIVTIAIFICYWANRFIQRHAKWAIGNF